MGVTLAPPIVVDMSLLNTREIANLIWLGALSVPFIFTIVYVAPVRKSVGGVFKAAASPILIGAFLACILAIVAATALLERAQVWDASLIKETIVFGLATAIPMIFNKRVMSGKATFAAVIAPVVGLPLLVETASALRTFDLWIELCLVPVVFVLVLSSALAKTGKAKLFCELVLGFAGTVLLVWSVTTFVVSASSADWTNLFKTIVYIGAMSVLLAIYAIWFAWFASFHTAFKWLDFRAQKMSKTAWRAKFAVLFVYAGDAGSLAGLAPVDVWPVVEAATYREAVSAARKAPDRQARLNELKNRAANRLLEFADIEGADADGRRLDQREFAETKSALSWLHLCMMGQYSKQNRFRQEVLEIAGPYVRHGLTEDHGITLRVSPSGQQWFAWRTTVTGWSFAIGQSNPRDEWRWDGQSVPTSFLCTGSVWGTVGGSSTKNW